MAALTGLNDILNRLTGGAGAVEALQFFKVDGLAPTAGRPHTLWTINGWPCLAGAAPTTAVAPTRTTQGALGQINPSANKWLVQAHATVSHGGTLILYDRLSHQGGLSGTVTGAQTTNLPTAALTRYTTGAGCWAWAEIYSQVGGTATTITCSYTNPASTAGRTSPTVTFGGAGASEVLRVIPFPLQSGDTGFRSIESVTLAASTAFAGSFGVTIGRPLAFINQSSAADVSGTQAEGGSISFMGGMPGIPNILTDACLAFLYIPATATGTMAEISGQLTMVES